MYENSSRYAGGKRGAAYLCTSEATKQAAARRAGVGTGAVQVVLLVAALKSTGAQVRAVDVAATELGAFTALKQQIAEAKRAGWLSSNKGKLHVTSSGRQLVADVTRGWERAARKLVAFSSALPFRKRAARRSDDQA